MASLTIFICLQLILDWFQMVVMWRCLVLGKVQANLHLQILGYLSSVKLFDSDWLFLTHLLSLYYLVFSLIFRGSRPEVFCKNGVLSNFTKFTENSHLCQSLFFNKVAGLRPAALLKKRLSVVEMTFNFSDIQIYAWNTKHRKDILLNNLRSKYSLILKFSLLM